MISGLPLISKGHLKAGDLDGSTAVVTGGGGGIGFHAARSLTWLGATTVIAEVDRQRGESAEAAINDNLGGRRCVFEHVDLGDTASLRRFARRILRQYSGVDYLLNNATTVSVGAVWETRISDWDHSYRVNLRAPVYLAACFLPGMLKKRRGVIMFVSSSGASPFLGAYEVFKTGQAELSGTLAAELEGTGVSALTMAPGFVKTATALRAVESLAPLRGMTTDELLESIGEEACMEVEAAGAGFAAGIALADRFHGQEIASVQALSEAGIERNGGATLESGISTRIPPEAAVLLGEIHTTLQQQADDWNPHSFKGQYVLRDFRKTTGDAPERILARIEQLRSMVASGGECTATAVKAARLGVLRTYYVHKIEMMNGWEKDVQKRKEYLEIMTGWIDAIDRFRAMVETARVAASGGGPG